MEPGRLAELSHGLQAEKRIALYAPSALAAEHAGEYVSNGIDIRRNVESPPEQIVARVNDDRDFFGGHDLPQAVNEFCTAGTTAQNADHAALFILARPSSSV